MSNFKLRKGMSIGSLAAENDIYLQEAFIDAGYVDQLCDCNDRAFLLLGRAGSGKTAIIRKIEEQRGRIVVRIDPEELSMQYLQNSVLREIAGWGVNLEIFHKYLWRHVCILALARIRYQEPDKIPNKLSSLPGIREIFFGDQKKEHDARVKAQAYIEEYSILRHILDYHRRQDKKDYIRNGEPT